MLKSPFKRTNDIAYAHCDAPCGVYDPASARVAAEAVLSLTKKILDLKLPDSDNEQAILAHHHTLMRYSLIKEDQAQKAKDELLILWTDYFKAPHLEENPELHDMFWKAAKLCSTCKVEISLEHAEELLEAIHKIHDIFWTTKKRKVEWYTAS